MAEGESKPDDLRITNRAELKAFLRGRPKGEAVAIALRAAWRVLPFVSVAEDETLFKRLTLVTFRATLSAQRAPAYAAAGGWASRMSGWEIIQTDCQYLLDGQGSLLSVPLWSERSKASEMQQARDSVSMRGWKRLASRGRWSRSGIIKSCRMPLSTRFPFRHWITSLRKAESSGATARTIHATQTRSWQTLPNGWAGDRKLLRMS